MIGAGPRIWLADLFRARARLGGERDLLALAAHLLLRAGFDEERAERSNARSVFSFEEGLTEPESVEDDDADEDEPEPFDDGLDDIVATFPELEPIRTDPVPVTDWRLVSSLPAAATARLDLRPPFIPLLPPGATPAILQAALGARTAGSEPDTERMVERIARGLPVTRIVRRPRTTMRFGTQVLLDVGEAMEPFARDQRELVDRVKGQVGADGVEVLSFIDAPLRGVRRGRSRVREPYRAPAPGTRVLIVSDLGAGGRPLNPLRADPGEWLAFVDRLEREQCGAVALVPFPPERIPAPLASRLRILTWDRSTGVGRAARAAAR